MAENLKHADSPDAPRKRNGEFIGGYVNPNVAQFIRDMAKADNKTVSHFLSVHFQKLLNETKENGSK